MPRKIPLITMREWLESYEKGESETSIARRAKRDVRTIKRGIELVRRERDARTARAEIVKEAMVRHHTDLARVLSELIRAIALPPQQLEPLGRPPGSFFPVPLTSAIANHLPTGEWTVTFSAEDGYPWNLLEEHLKYESEWKLVVQWKRAVSSWVGKAISFEQKIEVMVGDATRLEIITDMPEPPLKRYLLPTVVRLLYDLSLNASAHSVTEMKKQVTHTDDSRIWYGNQRIPLGAAPGNVEKCKAGIVEAWTRLMGSPELTEMSTAYKLVQELTVKTKRGLEELSALGLMPGECRVCRRLGT